MPDVDPAMARNVALLPWFRLLQNALFWQAVWFLYFQNELSAADALLLYAIYDISVTVFEAPSGYLSDRLGRRGTLIIAALAMFVGLCILGIGAGFWVFAAGQAIYGLGMACVSGTDNALLYESLDSENRDAAMEVQSLRMFRFGFVGLAVSAVLGGFMALYSYQLPFIASAVVFAALIAVALRLAEPPQTQTTRTMMTERDRLRSLMSSLRSPALMWLFVYGVLFYGFSHLPFVYGQPFINASLNDAGLTENAAPVVAGCVTGAMMLLSLLVSLVAPRLRNIFGLAGILVLAMGILVVIPATMAVSGSTLVILILLLRKIPDSISVAYQVAAVQPLVRNETRATYMSLQSLFGKLLFAMTLWLAASSTVQVGEMPLADIQNILSVYAIGGAICFALLFLAVFRIRL